jgi:lysophospholipase L1-like esterase
VSLRARAIAFRALPSLAVLAFLLAVEGVTRLALPPLPALDVLVAPYQARQLVGKQDTEKRRTRPRLFEADPLLFWRMRPNIDRLWWDGTIVSTNERGLRHPEPIGPKRAGVRRIVCLGDSVTYGTRVPYAASADTAPAPGAPYPRLVESLLRERGQQAEVIAMAVPGYSSHQGLAWVRRDLRSLDPDVVTICYGWNDVSQMPLSDDDAMPVDALHVAARQALIHSQAGLRLMSAVRSMRRVRPAALVLVPRSSREAYVANVRGIVAEVARMKARALVIGPVYRDATTVPDEAARMHEYRQALAEAMHADGVPYLEVPELTEAGAPGNTDLFVEHIHPNAQGHRVLARAVVTALD